jgi:DNA polymerase-3 subunit alpha
MADTIQELNFQIKSCERCKLAQVRKEENGKIVIGRGSKNPRILFVGEGPGMSEMKEGRPFCGRSGVLLDLALKKNNIKDFAIVNVIKCHTPSNRVPEQDEITACKPWIEEQIRLLDPQIIVPLGNTALKFFFPTKGITASHKQTFDLKDDRKAIPLYHPAYILRNPTMKEQYIKDFSILNNNPQSEPQKEEKEEIKKNHILKEISISNSQEAVLVSPSKIDDQNQPFIHLHCHSEQGSPGDVFRSLDDWALDLKEKKFKSVALTDHGSLSGLFYFQKSMQKQGITPILGIELYVKEGKKTSHMVLLVKNKIGWQNLLKIRRNSWINRDVGKSAGNNSRVSIEDVLENHEGLIVSTACINGFLGYKIKNQLEYESMILKFKEVFGEDFYLELQPHAIPEQVMVNKVVIQLHEKYNIPIIITGDSHYIHKEDKEIHNVVEALRYRRVFHKDVTINDNPGFTGNTYYNFTSEELGQLVEENHSYLKPYLSEAMANTLKIADKCNFILPNSYENTLPEIPDAEEYVAAKITSNMHLVAHHDPKLIQERLDLELTRIRNKNFLPYFVIVARLFEYAKQQGIPCGPGRGSSGGSLVSYLLGITKVDPIRFNLLFERFYSEARIDPPDIDSDFSQERREELIGYLKSQYGNDSVSNIITFSKWKGKGVFRDVCRIYNIPLSEVNLVAKFIESTKEGTDIQNAIDKNDIVKEFYKKNPKVMDIAKALEGHTNFYGKHAAGIVICPHLAERIPLEAIKDAELTSWEKDALSDLGIIKLDLLGLSILDEIDRTITNANLTWEDLPYEFDDPKVYNLLNKGLTMGCHQMETVFATQYLKTVHPDNFQELMDVTCLLRPGAMESGASAEYILRKNGKKWDHYHPLLKDITGPSLGLILTQEQVMQTFCTIGGFTQGEAEKARKIIGKSKGSSALNVMREQFVKGSININKISESEANDLFDKLITFGKYGFNASHSTAYSYLTYWSAWLKANYPLETFAAFMDNANSEQLAIYIREAHEMGITVRPPSIESPHVNNSFDKEKNAVYIGLHLLQQIGESEAQVIISSGKSFARLKKNVSERTLKILIEVGYFDSIEPNRKQLYRNLELSKNTLSRFLEDPIVYRDWSTNEKLTRMRKHLSWPHSSSELPETIYDKHIITLDQYNQEREEIETPILLKGWIYNLREFDSKDGNSKTAYLEFGDGSSGARIALVLPYGLFNTYKNIVEQVKTGELVDPIMILVNPYFNSFKAGLHKKEGKLNILKIFKLGEQISDKILRVLNLEELQLKKNQMIVTSTNFFTSKKGNQCCIATTIDHLGLSGKGLIMMNKSPLTPDIGGIINGRWNEDGFLVGG